VDDPPNRSLREPRLGLKTEIRSSSLRHRPTHALSFDIEDWFHIVGIKATTDPTRWVEFPSIVERYTRQIVGLLREFDVRATFFVLGWIAERYPSVVRMIADAGHEIGTHSFWHRRVGELSPDAFYEDLLDSIEVLEQHEGVKVRGFRAPSFSIVPGMEWAFDVIKKCGLEYDASLFPARRAHGGGYAGADGPCLVESQESGPLAELPIAVFPRGPFRFCFSGGGYFRLFPGWLVEYGVRRLEASGQSAVLYLHPRDFATDCPKVSMPLHRRFKCYVGRGSTAAKLRRLLTRHRFSTCYDVLCQHGLLQTGEPSVETDIEGQTSQGVADRRDSAPSESP